MPDRRQQPAGAERMRALTQALLATGVLDPTDVWHVHEQPYTDGYLLTLGPVTDPSSYDECTCSLWVAKVSTNGADVQVCLTGGVLDPEAEGTGLPDIMDV